MNFTDLPAVGAELDGGLFAGITTKKDGTHCAVVLLSGRGEKLTWKKAMNWAEKQGGELPTRQVAALLFANVKDKLEPLWHWTSDQYDASCAWDCYFYDGGQDYNRKSFEGSAVAVRLIPLTARSFNPLTPGAPTVSAITLEAIQAKQTELAKMIQQLTEQATDQGREIEIEGNIISLAPGEHYAGAVLDKNGNHMHNLVLMAARPEKRLDWQASMDWAEKVGGALPTRQEQALLFANCKPHLDDTWHWSCETHAGDDYYAWGCSFYDGDQSSDLKTFEGSAVAVRMIPIGDK